MIDVNVKQQISDVRREVGSRVLEAGQARTVTISRTFAASRDEVWDACTNPDRIPRWFLPVTGELRLHGRYQLEGNAGGTIERCDPPRSFSATWEFGDQITWIEVRVSPGGPERTRLEIEHIALEDERWREFGPGAVGVGWDLAVIALTEHMSSGRSVDPAAGMAWTRSQPGRAFMTLSSEAWRDAHVAAGATPADARAAAQRTTAAYTGTELA